MKYRVLALLMVPMMAAACGDEQGIALGTDDVGDNADVEEDTTEVPDATEDGVVNPDATADTTEEVVDAGPTFESLFEECESDDECEGDDVCFQNICLREPIIEAALWVEEDNGYTPQDEDPDLSCWVEPTELESGSETVSMYGDVELFGPESPSRNLCVTVYDQSIFLEWSVWLADNVCEDFRDVDLRGQEPFINCFALDPCRCDDEDFTAGRGDAGDSLEACYAEIGFCVALDDEPELQAQCRQNILDRTGVEADTLVLGSVLSTEHPDNPDRTEGVYAMDMIPTNKWVIVKVSGRMRRWRDTYEFNSILRADREDDEGAVRWDANVITDGAWRTIPQSAGMADPIEPDATAIAGVVRDCSPERNNQVEGVRVGFREDPLAIAYFNGISSDNLPQPGQAYTNKDGVYAALGAPSGPNRVSLIAEQDGEFVSAGVRDVFAMPFSVIIATFEGNYDVE